MLIGTVKSYSGETGWGFIVPDDGGDDVFVHARSLVGIEKYMREGQRVGFIVKMTEKGRRAINVIVLERDQQKSM